MNLELSDEQVFLRDAARGALAGVDTLEAARAALDGADLPDLWALASEAGWPGLLIAEEDGGVGLGLFDAILVTLECGRKLAGVPLLGHLAATATLAHAGAGELPGGVTLEALAGGERRAALIPCRPPSDLDDDWSVQAEAGTVRLPLPELRGGADTLTVTGEAYWVPDLPGADVLVLGAQGDRGPVVVAVSPQAAGVTIEARTRYDATRAIGHVRLADTPCTVLSADEEALAQGWYAAQALIGAECLGAVEAALEMTVQYAKDRHTFGRPIGSYQAIKHALVEVLRQAENTRSLLFYAGWSHAGAPEEFPMAASAARSSGDRALEYAALKTITIHGGIGATWEHDAPLYFRRSQLTRMLVGGSADAADRVAAEVLERARREAADPLEQVA